MGPFQFGGSASCTFSWSGQPAWAPTNRYPFGPTPSGNFPATGSTTNTLTIT